MGYLRSTPGGGNNQGGLSRPGPVGTASDVRQPFVTPILEDQSAAVISGTLATTEAADVAAVSGNVWISGALAKSEAIDTAAATGSVWVTAALAQTDAADVAALLGDHGAVATNQKYWATGYWAQGYWSDAYWSREGGEVVSVPSTGGVYFPPIPRARLPIDGELRTSEQPDWCDLIGDLSWYDDDELALELLGIAA